MAAEKTEAIVLRVVEYSETSSIVTLMTESHGKISALAKGARRKKSPFENALDLLAVCHVVFLPRPNSSLELLTEAKLERRFRGVENGLPALYAGYYVSELLSYLTQEHDANSAAYSVAKQTLRNLETCSETSEVPHAILNFELSLLKHIGQLPMASNCAGCGQPTPVNGRILFGLVAGGVICTNCRTGQGNLVHLSENAHRELVTRTKRLATDDPQSQTLASSTETAELRKLMNRYISHLLGFPPRLHSFIN